MDARHYIVMATLACLTLAVYLRKHTSESVRALAAYPEVFLAICVGGAVSIFASH